MNRLYTEKPDIKIGTETWLNYDVQHSDEFSPAKFYEVERKDRQDSQGGILLTIKKDLNSRKISINAERKIQVKVTRESRSPSIVGSLYIPPKSDLSYMQLLRLSAVAKITKIRNAIFWIGGDLHLPDIEWSLNTTVSHQML